MRALIATLLCAAPFAAKFSPEIVGELHPVPPVPGEYAMSLDMKFETFPSMEMRIDEHRLGAMKLSLSPDGGARACVGSKTTKSSLGQFRYEPPEKRKGLSSDTTVQLMALAGSWKVTADGLAAMRFEKLAWSTCELTNAAETAQPVELKCLMTAPTGPIPTGALVCEAGPMSDLLGLGMPMQGRDAGVVGPIHGAPTGRHLVLSTPGIGALVEQGRDAAGPVITFPRGAAPFREADFVVSRPGSR